MARKTKEEAHETRERLLGSALEIMSAKPFSKVSMNEIAERIGLSKGAAYWHFKNKNNVLVNLIESICLEEGKDLELDAEEFVLEDRSALRRYFKNKMAKALDNERSRRMAMLMQRKMEWPEDVREKIFSIIKNWAETERMMVERFLSKWQKEGKIRGDVSVRDLSAVIPAVFQGLLIFQLMGIFSIDLIKQTDFIFDAFSEELKPQKIKN
ncbi:MAG: TetR family transcriptional regulator [Synergistaceae bacterium]|nr:TetR family transcriptional regulator [Synergistaceae bacterium]